MTKLDHLDPRFRRPPAPTKPDLTPYFDEILSGVLTRNTDQAERERRLQAALKAAFKNLEAQVNAIPSTDLTPVLAAVAALATAVKAIKFPEVRIPPSTDIAPVLQQTGAIASRLEDVVSKLDNLDFPDMPDVSVSVPQQAVQVVEPEPRKWNFKIIRNASGGIREVEATAE